MATKYDIDTVRKLFAKRDFRLLESEYRNNHTKMAYECPTCGETRWLSLKRLLRNESGCEPCAKGRRAEKRKLTFETACEDFKKVGLELLETEQPDPESPR